MRNLVRTASGKSAAAFLPDSFPRHAIAVIAVWLPLLNHLRLEWSINEQYQYGFFVPIIAAWLAWLRWTDRPAPQHFHSRLLLGPIAAACVGAISLVMLVEAANSDWRLLSWLWTLLVVLVTGLGILAIGGGAWLRHFIVPLGFIFLAVPWPMTLEVKVVNELTSVNATLAVQMLNWLGVPADQFGNVVAITNAEIGIEDACSGVRSLQSSIMVACLLGETFRLPVVLRAALVGACIASGLAWNLARTLVLVWLAGAKSEAAMNAWHDQIGMVCLAFAWATWFSLGKIASYLASVRSGERRTVAESVHIPPRESTGVRAFEGAAHLSASCCLSIAGFVVLSALSVEGWYRTGGSPIGEGYAWTAHPPAEFRFSESPIPQRVRGMLKYSQGANWVWEDADGKRWSAFYLKWDAGRTAAALAGTHRPEICLPATGRALVEDRGVELFRANGITLPFRHAVFREKHEALHVFFSLSREGANPETSMETSTRLTRSERMRSVLQRRRNEGQQQLEIAVWGASDAKIAKREFLAVLKGMVRVKTTPVGSP